MRDWNGNYSSNWNDLVSPVGKDKPADPK
jgi:hypothetical protein